MKNLFSQILLIASIFMLFNLYTEAEPIKKEQEQLTAEEKKKMEKALQDLRDYVDSIGKKKEPYSVIYNTEFIDEMTDSITYATIIASDDYGKYEHQGKAKFIITCENGKIDSYITFPEFIGEPTSLHMRFDKNKMKKMLKVTGSADNHGIFVGGNLSWVIKNSMNSSIMVARGYDYEYVSDSPYTFSLAGSPQKINVTLAKGGCVKK